MLGCLNKGRKKERWDETFSLVMPDGDGHRHISLKVPYVEFDSMLGFQHSCTDRSNPYVEIEIMSTYHSVKMRC